MNRDHIIPPGTDFRHVFVLQSREWWTSAQPLYDPARDLVLTYDFGLRRKVEALGGRAYFVDHLCSQSEMQANNALAARFFTKWHYDEHGSDIFTSREVSFGFAFRIEMWSEYLFYVRLRASLDKLRGVTYEQVHLGEGTARLGSVLREMGIHFTELDRGHDTDSPVYFFDIHQYMTQALHNRSVGSLMRKAAVTTLTAVVSWVDRLLASGSTKKTVYVQVYHPTRALIARLRSDPEVKVVTPSVVRGQGLRRALVQRLIPIRGRVKNFAGEATVLLDNFRNNRFARLVLVGGTDISAGAYSVIEHQVAPRVSEALRILTSVLRYVEDNPIHLEVMIANLGVLQTIVDCVLKESGVPRYLIINGMLWGEFDEGKHATHINGYSTSIKNNYFSGDRRVVCLGDPRMDNYHGRTKPGGIQRTTPNVTIGASGFNNVDLNSYSAVEFDFMFDVLTALQDLVAAGNALTTTIKVRPNGVLEQYAQFTAEYFPDMEIELLREVSMQEVLTRTDLYISIYSQTVFEASCLGIPVIYYKKDVEVSGPPFDQQSELVTVDTIDALKQAVRDFQADDDRFRPFLDRTVMEKYVGPLDGKNVERNLGFIYGLLGTSR